jgi:hypothetical protein
MKQEALQISQLVGLPRRFHGTPPTRWSGTSVKFAGQSGRTDIFANDGTHELWRLLELEKFVCSSGYVRRALRK